MVKAVLAVALTAAAIAFGSLLGSGTETNVAAVIEWSIAFGFTIYLLTFWTDLRASKGISKGEMNVQRLAEMGEIAPNRLR